jgi:cadmium resistance protein CadD (predicted permease)
MWLFSALVTGIVAFAVTNLDDIFILMAWYSRLDTSFRKRHVILGQFLGFGALAFLSIIISLGAMIFPREWLGVIGILPVWLGVKALYDIWKNKGVGDEESEAEETVEEAGQRSSNIPHWLSVVLSPHVFKVAMLTFANGGDNIGVYVPLFAKGNIADMIVILIVFFLLVGFWCYISFKLVRHHSIAKVLDKFGHILVPFILIALGIYIFFSSGLLHKFI